MTHISPYETVELYGRPAPTHVPEKAAEDQARVTAYDVYEALYDNQPELFAKVLNIDGANELFRRLVPTARSIVEATNRYFARGMEWVAHSPGASPVTGDSGGAAPPSGADNSGSGQAALNQEAVGMALAVLEKLFRREEFGAKFLSLKRWMLIRGDALLHVTADQSKPEGTRLRIVEIDPRAYFAIPDPADAERVIGCYITNVIKNDEDEEIVARLEYQRIIDDEMGAKYNGTPIGQVFTRLTFWTLDGWDDRQSEDDLETAPAPSRFTGERFVTLLEGYALPAQITAIPVYHFRNNRRGNRLFGISELQGLETLINGVNQTATDQEIAVAMQGLGVYYTDSGRPVDREGNTINWEISPASMLTIEEGRTLGRVQGVGSVQPSLDHIAFMKSEGQEASGVPKIAVGGVDASSVASGVALSIEMAPMVAKNEEKEEEVIAKLNQMVNDLLNGFLPAYEGWTPNGVEISVAFADPVPTNRESAVQELVDLVTAKIISAAYAREMLHQRLGYVFVTDVAAELAAEAQVQADIAGARMDADIAAGAGPEQEVGL